MNNLTYSFPRSLSISYYDYPLNRQPFLLVIASTNLFHIETTFFIKKIKITRDTVIFSTKETTLISTMATQNDQPTLTQHQISKKIFFNI